MSDTIGMLDDIDGTLRLLHRSARRRRGIIIAYYSQLWEPILKVAEAFGLRSSSRRSTTSPPPTSSTCSISPISS